MIGFKSKFLITSEIEDAKATFNIWRRNYGCDLCTDDNEQSMTAINSKGVAVELKPLTRVSINQDYFDPTN